MRRYSEECGRSSEIYILDDGIRLDFRIDRPTNAEDKVPLVIMIHGFKGNKEERHILAVSKIGHNTTTEERNTLHEVSLKACTGLDLTGYKAL